MKEITDNERIGVILLGYLGDVINSSGIFKRIKEVKPNAELSLITLPGSKPAAMGIPEIDNIYCFNKNQNKSIIKTIQFALTLKGKFDTIIVLDNSLRSAYLAYFTGAKRRIGRGKEFREIFLTDVIPYLDEEKNMQIPVSEHYSRCLKPLGLYVENIQPDFVFKKEDNAAVDNLLKESNLYGKKLLGICPACHKEDKSMKFDDIKHLISKINNETEYEVVIVGGKDISAMVNDLKSDSTVKLTDFTGKTPFLQTAALISKFSKFISVDTSCMHLALARKVPTVAIFFSNVYKKWGPVDLNRNALYINEQSRDTDINAVMEKILALPE